MSLFLLLNPKQYPTAPVEVDKSDVWYKDKRKRKQLEEQLAADELTRQLEEYAASAEYKTEEIKEALSKLHRKGYHRLGKYHKRTIDELLLLILLHDD